MPNKLIKPIDALRLKNTRLNIVKDNLALNLPESIAKTQHLHELILEAQIEELENELAR